MKLSVVIVNYNVKYFLEQALLSVRKALEGIEGEVFVVDNNSVDDSVIMVRDKFPEVRLIQNNSNPGFSKANNQAIEESSGEYVLLLNPDTVVEEDTFRICLGFMDSHKDAGALGVKMIDGSGKFLPESKRGLPTPWVAFCRMFGLSWLFPRSQTFNKYHLGFLDENETHEIEILAGAFMFIRKSVLDEVGLLDETFFMYGEDIDLSHRIGKAGYKIYYHPKSKIIHYKGESTKKGSLNYVLTFYNAMIIFAKKHFSSRQAQLFTILIRAAILFRGLLTLLGNGFKKLVWPLLDFAMIFGGLFLLKQVWANFYFQDPNYYPDYVTYTVLPSYSFLWVISILFNGGYDKPLRIGSLLRGILVGTLILAAIYAFLSLEYRSSRILILLGTFWAISILPLSRMLRNLIRHGGLRSKKDAQERVAIVGSPEEYLRTNLLLDKAGVKKNVLGRIAATDDPKDQFSLIGNINQLSDIVRIH
ncbi:MAG: glycosyltransferase, partial [Saprospiraceae bacterium]|nr:glycosyltransferase [Saprospiraceae bacterium]